MRAIELNQVSKEIIDRYAGSPLVIAKELDKYKLRYNKQRRGGLVLYTVRSKDSKNPFMLFSPKRDNHFTSQTCTKIQNIT